MSEAETISLKVKDQNGTEVQFRVKKTTKMEKIFVAYANRKGISIDQIRFQLDGERVNPNQTPKMLELEDGDQIDCVVEQTGGM